LPAGVPTLKQPAHYGRSQPKEIFEAQEHVVVFVGESEENKGSPATQQATRDVPKTIHEQTKTGHATSLINDTHQPTHQSHVHTSEASQPAQASNTSQNSEFTKMQE
jgi:hypothetical protein